VEQAQRVEPGVAWAGVILAGAYNGAHRWADAVVVLENLQGAEADTWQARYERTRAAIGPRDVEGALHSSEQAVTMAPASFVEVHLLRAHALSLAGAGRRRSRRWRRISIVSNRSRTGRRYWRCSSRRAAWSGRTTPWPRDKQRWILGGRVRGRAESGRLGSGRG
jgi:hypothetical protein